MQQPTQVIAAIPPSLQLMIQFQASVLRNIVGAVFKPEFGDELYTEVANSIISGINADVDKMKKNPQLANRVIDGSLEEHRNDLVMSIKAIANTFAAKELFKLEMPEPPAEEKPEEAPSSLILNV